MSSNGALVSPSSIDQSVESVLQRSSCVGASRRDVAPVSISPLVMVDCRLQAADSEVDPVNGNSVSFQRDSESSDVGLMSVELVLDGSARIVLAVTEFNFVLVLCFQRFDDMSFSSDQSLVVGNFVNMNLNLSMVNCDLMMQMMNITSVASDHLLVSADLLIIIFTFKLSFRSS